MAGGRLGRFEQRVMAPLAVLFLVLAVAYFVQKAWLVGGLLVFGWFLIAALGQSLNKRKSFARLAQGRTPEEKVVSFQMEPTVEETNQIGGACVRTALVVCGAVILLSFHHGLRVYIAIPLGLVAFYLLILVGGAVSMKVKRK